MANRNWSNGRAFYAMHVKPVILDCSFIVDPNNGNGLGIRSLKGPCISNVYMHSTPTGVVQSSVFGSGVLTITVASTTGIIVGSVVTDGTTGGNISAGTRVTNISGTTLTLSLATAGASASAPGDSLTFTPVAPGNPNPAAGIIIVKFADNYNRYLGGFDGFVAPVSGSSLTAVVANTTYTIVSLGTATLAQWVAVGFPLGFTPAVGATFTASITGTIGGSAAVEVPAAAGAGVNHIELIGDANQTLANNLQPSYGGAIITLGAYSNAGGGANVLTAPATNTAIGLAFYFNDSSVQVAGE